MTELTKMSISEQGIKLQQINVDINKLFSLSYTFDNLKLIMNTLLENQNIISSKINEIEKKLKEEKNESANNITILEKKIKTMILTMKKDPTKLLKTEKKIIEKITEKEKEKLDEKEVKIDENKEKEEKEKKDKNEDAEAIKQKIEKNKEESVVEPGSGSKVEEEEDDDDDDNNFGIEKEEFENMKQKMDALEQRLVAMEKQSKFNATKLLDQSGNNEDVRLLKLNMKSMEDKFRDLNKEKEQMAKTLEEIKVKVTDFNIYELFKDAKTTEGSVDVSKLLVMNLEEKFIKKTTIMDEKLKKNDDDMFLLKNEFQNVKNKGDVINDSLNGFKNTVKEISDQVNKANDINSNMVNETNNKINEVYKKILQKIDEDKKSTKKNLEKIKNYMKKLHEKEEVENKKLTEGHGELSDTDLRCLTELTKRVADLERQMKILYHGLDVSKTKEDLAKLENELMQKINEKDFFELSDKVNLISTAINNIRDNVERVQDIGNKNTKDLNFYLRKMESLNASVYAFKAALDVISGTKSDNIFDPNRYLELSTFNDFIKSYQKDLEKLDKRIDEVRRLISDMVGIINTKASGEDMKTFENLINNKLDEVKLFCTRKFSDKMDTNKNFKYVDAQIKHITQIVLKRNDKNEAWILAKKPIGGYSCASCEAYIGDLKDKGDFLAWNKYPNREKEKNFRIGNGFSHMLNMLNVDLKSQENTNKENNYDSDDEIRRTGMEGKGTHPKNASKMNMMNTVGLNGFNRSNILPKILNKNEDNMANMTAENLDRNSEQFIPGTGQLISYDDNNFSYNSRQPHIVRVYRKNKYSVPDLSRTDK